MAMEAPQVVYRILSHDGSEWPRVYEYFGRLGLRSDIIPPPKFAQAIVAEYEGEIVACVFLQIALHLEPLTLDAQHAGRIHLRSLMAKAEEAHRASVFAQLPFFAFIDAGERTERISELLGFEKLENVAIWCRSKLRDFVPGKKMRKEDAA